MLVVQSLQKSRWKNIICIQNSREEKAAVTAREVTINLRKTKKVIAILRYGVIISNTNYSCLISVSLHFFDAAVAFGRSERV